MSRSLCHLRLRDLDEPAHLQPGAVRVSGHPPRDRLPRLRIGVRSDVFLHLFSSTASVLIVPEVQVSTPSDRLHAVSAPDHHSPSPRIVDPAMCYRYLTITTRTAKLLPSQDSGGPVVRLVGGSQQFHQVRLRDNASDLSFCGDEDRVIVTEQAGREFHGSLGIDLRERGLHDLVHPDPREVLRVPAGQDEVVDHLVRNRADRMAIVHDRHLGELPAAHLIHGGFERDPRLHILDLAALDLVHERFLLLPFQLRLEGVHDPLHAIVRRIHLPLLDLHDRRLADVREASDRGLRESERLPQPRDLLQVRHHRPPRRPGSTYSCRNFRLNQILSEGPFSGGLETTCLGVVPSAERARATKAIYGTGHPRRTPVGGLPWRGTSLLRNSSTRRSRSRAMRSSNGRGSAIRTASRTGWRRPSPSPSARCTRNASDGSCITTRTRSRSSAVRAPRSSGAASSSNRRTSSWSAGRRRW